jgi:AraC-like DNA-binding protein
VSVASAIVEGAKLRLRTPVEGLRSYLGCFWTMKTSAATRLRSLPDACAAISCQVSARGTVRCFLVGPSLVPRGRRPKAGQELFGVRLRPGVGFVLLGTPMHKMTGRRARLEAAMPGQGSELAKRLGEATTVDDRIDILENFLNQRLAGAKIEPRVALVLRRMEASGGQVRIPELVRECEVSARQLRRLLITWVGLSPKRLARVIRLQAFLQHAETSPETKPTETALELGYFDQAHMSNEVARLAGASPGAIVPERVADFSKTRCG